MARALSAETISRSEVDALAKQEWFWDAFFRKFPSAAALVELSAVAFDAPAGEALVYCGSLTNALAGHGFLVLLKRTEAGWVPVSWQPLWES